MRSPIYWIDAPAPGRLAIMARPRAGDWLTGEIAGWKENGLDVVVSLLEAEEIAELGLEDEALLCANSKVDFVSFPIPDRGVPNSPREALALAKLICARLADGMAVAVHCRAGIGRSSVIAACTLMCLGVPADEALEMIRRARGLKVPDTDTQRAWMLAFDPDGQER